MPIEGTPAHSVHTSLERLSGAFSVGDIMVRADNLLRCESAEEAARLFEQYDTLPFPRCGAIQGYFHKDESPGQWSPLRQAHLLSDSTRLVDLPALFEQRHFYFILAGNRVSGFIHYADLNHPLVKLPLYLLFEAVESALWPEINQRTQESDLRAVLPKRARGIVRRRQAQEEEQSDLGWVGLLSFRELLQLACYHHLVELGQPELEQIVEVRNRVAHSDQPLVRDKASLSRIVEARHTLDRLLGASVLAPPV